MVLTNSTPNNNSKHNEIVVDMAAMRREDFSELLMLNAEIEQRRSLRSQSMVGDGSGLLKNTMTREEIFEISSLDDDKFLSALEHQNSFVASRRVQVTDLDLSSIENLMKYFDEDVPITPPRASVVSCCQGKVANALASFKSKISPQPGSPATVAAATTTTQSPSRITTIRMPKISELKEKYESQSQSQQDLVPIETPPKPPAKPALLPTKVKEIAQLFNSKINQVMRRGSGNVSTYSPLQNEFSPEPKGPVLPPPPARHKRVSYRLPGLPSPVPSPRQRRRAAQKPAHSPCLVAEEVFRELSVKDKALLFNKFIDEMSAKHPKFNAHAAGLQAQVKKQIARGEVVNEQQATVKHLAQELEAKCTISAATSPQRSHLQSPLSRQLVNQRNQPVPVATTPKDESRLHVSTLTVVLKPSPEATFKRQVLSSAKRRQMMASANRTQKRNSAAIRSTLLTTEPYAPPKKIRRTRHERLGESALFFQNDQLENLFYNWLREENGVLFDITSASNEEHTIEIAIEEDEVEQAAGGHNNASSNAANHTDSNTEDVTQKSAVERLLEEAIAKLEESKSLCVDEKDAPSTLPSTTQSSTPSTATPRDTPTPSTVSPKDTPSVTPRKTKRRAPPVPAPRPSLQSQSTTTSSSAISSCKQSDAEESESGLSTLPKITSDDSQPEQHHQQQQDNPSGDFDFTKPVRPPRKKKMRRTLTWKKENCIVEAKAVTTTDSDSDHKKTSAHSNNTHNNNSSSNNKKKPPVTPAKTEQSFTELNQSLLRHVNSPRKIKSAYTLTVMSSPSPNAESETETPRPSMEPTVIAKPFTLTDSFIDQGFETGNEPDRSPMRPMRTSLRELQTPSPDNNACEPLFATSSPRPTLEGNSGKSRKPSSFSTPVKGNAAQRNFSPASNSPAAQQQLFSPIAKQQREGRRSSLAMQVIREDLPLDLDATVDSSAVSTPCDFSANESAFFANAPTVDMPSNIDDITMSKPVSMFWITAGTITVSLEIFHSANDRLRLLYEIFTQKHSEAKDIAFGIDDQKFTRNDEQDEHEEQPNPPLQQRLPSAKGCSHYWFASGDLTVPFSGQLMATEKIQRLFKFIGDELTPNEELRFGVDQFEFSSVPEFWHNTPKFSIESSYSMLVGLQTGNSNGLEGRNKSSWPNTSGGVKTSDLDHSEFESDSLSNSGRLSFSPDMFSLDYEHVPLDELFDQHQAAASSPRKIPTTTTTATATATGSIKSASSPMSLTQMVETLQQQQVKLKNMEHCIRSYPKSDNQMVNGALDNCKDTLEYVQKLRSIIRVIDNIGRDSGFRSCSVQQRESFMYFLIEYANICLSSCSDHMDKIIDSLLDRRAVTV